MTFQQQEGRHTGPRINPAVRTRAQGLKRENRKWGATKIGRILNKEFPHESLPSERQIYRWIHVVSEIDDQDRPWQFSQNEKADVPWEATPLLLRLTQRHADQLTNRVARWCWRVRTASPDLSDAHTFDLGKEYADREWLGEILDTDLYSGDLDGILTYQPWNSRESYTRYVQAVKDGVVAGDLGTGAFKDDDEEAAFRLAQKNGDLPRVPEMWRFAHLEPGHPR